MNERSHTKALLRIFIRSEIASAIGMKYLGYPLQNDVAASVEMIADISNFYPCNMKTEAEGVIQDPSLLLSKINRTLGNNRIYISNVMSGKNCK